MLWCYDNAIADDLRKSLTPIGECNPTVEVCDAESVIDLIAQIQDDNIQFPIVVITRNPDTPIDTKRYNFARCHSGIATTIDKNNYIYYEKALPIELSYDITVLATNTADMDEMVKELLFKYTEMYFIKFELPYESKRMLEFGVSIDPDTNITGKSGYLEYLRSGRLYQSIISLKCHGAVLLSYTPERLTHFGLDNEDRINIK